MVPETKIHNGVAVHKCWSTGKACAILTLCNPDAVQLDNIAPVHAKQIPSGDPGTIKIIHNQPVNPSDSQTFQVP